MRAVDFRTMAQDSLLETRSKLLTRNLYFFNLCTCALAKARKMDELQALTYFSSLTHISRKIALQEKSLIKYLGNKWTEYSPEHKEEILDDLCVPHFVRDEQRVVADDEDDRHVSCWPTLKLPSGEKIIVDENDVREFCFPIL